MTRDRAVAAALGVVTFAIFLGSPVRHGTDAQYTLLVSEQLLRRGTLRLDEHFSPAAAGVPGRATYNLERSGDHVYFRPAPGAAILSVPFVPVLRLFGLSALDERGRYDPAGDLRAQAVIAAFLMAALTILFFATARLVLPLGWSAGVALAGGLGTQVWSVASRALWSHTWEIAIIGYVVWRLARLEVLGRRVSPVWLAMLLSAAFLSRATAAGHALAVTAYVALFHREMLRRLLVSGLAALAAFVSAALAVYGRPMPSSYQVWQRASVGWMPVAAALVSPSRGLLVCVPLVPLVAALLVRYREHVSSRPLWVLGFLGLLLQILPAAVVKVWWAGQSYGPRLTTGTVPWLVLLGVLALRAGLEAGARTTRGLSTRPAALVPLLAVAALSVFIHARGALSESTQRWNLRPADVDVDPGRVWDWRYPQWLAGLVAVPGRTDFPPLAVASPLVFGGTQGDAYLRDGWSWVEDDLRWSDESDARIQFAASARGPNVLRIRMRPGPAWAEAGGLPLTLELNGEVLARWQLRDSGPAVYSAALSAVPARLSLSLKTPDLPVSPASRRERRPLRAGVYWLRLDPYPRLAPATPVAVGTADAEPYLGEGWGHAEGAYRWTVGPRALLYLAPEGIRAGILRMHMHPFPASARGSGQRVYVSLNGELAGTLALRGQDEVVHAVPLPAGLRGEDTVVLELPDAEAREGRAADERQLGVAVHWLRLDPFPMLASGRPVDLGAPGGDAFLGDGWADREGTTRWTTGLSADILFGVETTASRQLALTMEPFIAKGFPSQRVRVTLNGQSLGELTLSERGRRPYALPLPDGFLLAHNVLRLTFPDARSPASLGLSRDHRVLGVRVGALELRP